MSKVFKIRLKKGDNVVVLSGKEKGKTGKVVQTHPREGKVTIEGINIVKKAVKPNRRHPQGAIVEITKPVWAGKAAIVDPSTKKPSRIGYMMKNKQKVRIFKKSGKEIHPLKTSKSGGNK
jgi:large subunit ribosomal protein L24